MQIDNLVYIPTSQLHPHPDNPRKDVGDVSELAESIRQNGILQNLTVIPNINGGEGYTVIIGHRRLTAAKLAGAMSVPCTITEMTRKEQISTMLLENMQRSDLTVQEQAQGFQMMLDMGSTIEEIAKESGFSQSTVRRRVKMMELDQQALKAADRRGGTLADYMELDKLKSTKRKNELLKVIGTNNFKNELRKALSDEADEEVLSGYKNIVAEFATEIEELKYEGGRRFALLDGEWLPVDYIRNYSRWTKENTKKKPKDWKIRRYYYRCSESQIDLYADALQKSPADLAEEERKRKEKEVQEEKLSRAQEIGKRHRELRMEFLARVSDTAAKKNRSLIVGYTTKTMFKKITWNNSPCDRKILSKLVGEEIAEDKAGEWLTGFSQVHPERTLLFAVCTWYESQRGCYWFEKWSPEAQNYMCAHQPCPELDELYSLLAALGYEMSDEEQAMKAGTHEVFK